MIAPTAVDLVTSIRPLTRNEQEDDLLADFLDPLMEPMMCQWMVLEAILDTTGEDRRILEIFPVCLC